MACDHISCGSSEKVWLPYSYKGRELGLRPHLYCIKCGTIKNVSSDKPRNLGFYANVLASLGTEIKIAQVQMRLIALELQRMDFDDGYGLCKHQQDELFIEVVRKFINISEQRIIEHIS